MSRPGIEIRVSSRRGVVLQANSDMLYNLAALLGWNNAEEWSDFLSDHTGAVKLEVRQVELPDLEFDQADEVAAAECDDPEPPFGLYRCASVMCGRLYRRDHRGWTQPGDVYWARTWQEFCEDGDGDCTRNLIPLDHAGVISDVRNALLELVKDPRFTSWECNELRSLEQRLVAVSVRP